MSGQRQVAFSPDSSRSQSRSSRPSSCREEEGEEEVSPLLYRRRFPSTGRMLWSGPNYERDHHMTLLDNCYIGIGETSPEKTGNLSYLWRGGPSSPDPRPKTSHPGEIGWGYDPVPQVTMEHAPQIGYQVLSFDKTQHERLPKLVHPVLHKPRRDFTATFLSCQENPWADKMKYKSPRQEMRKVYKVSLLQPSLGKTRVTFSAQPIRS